MCGVAGIANVDNASTIIYTLLVALQHRGVESSGIVSTDTIDHWSYRKKGLANEIFTKEVLSTLKGNTAIGHNRYSTTGDNIFSNIQPFSVKSSFGWLSIAHNGNLINSKELSEQLKAKGSIFQSTTDTEVIIHLIAKSKKSLPEALIDALNLVQGSYSLLVLNTNMLIAIRDPYGFRPLSFGYYNNSPVFASETAAFDLIGVKNTREVQPGEMIIVDLKTNNIQSLFPFKSCQFRKCTFEYIYFARPDSTLSDKSVYEYRKELGNQLAKEHPVNADIVIPVPDSGIAAAIGYAQELNIPYEMGMIKNSYIARSFIQPSTTLRNNCINLKLNAIPNIIKNKKIVVIDDSLVRGNTSKKIIFMLKKAGAKEIHLRISSPPIISPCYYGIDIPNKDDLIANAKSIQEICSYIEADSLEFLSIEGLNSILDKNSCNACFTGNYPILIGLEKLK